ncbi:hypothetical protein AX16_006210 [Volvariella volvacea WC 439]|nr:hypothetical protein AX16_006210 [Volvariella volvacea WC 439]
MSKPKQQTRGKSTGERSAGERSAGERSSSGRPSLRDIAATTISTIEQGKYELNGVTYNLSAQVDYLKSNTIYYPPDSELSSWSTTMPLARRLVDGPSFTKISLLEISTLQGARRLSNYLKTTSGSGVGGADGTTVGVLNFASAKNPGGGFLKGAQAQEESLARSSTLYPSLMTPTAQKFYTLHKRDPQDGYYSHAMIYSPKVVLMRGDQGGWKEPVEVDILTSPAVNAGVVRRKLSEQGSTDESLIESTMRERMCRILYAFEKRGVRNIVLGSFGTGVFRNKVAVVASIWRELLVGEEARFGWSFDRVVFAVLGKETFPVFRSVFEGSDVVLHQDL